MKLDSRVGKADLPALADPIIEEALDVLSLFRENPFPDGYDIEPMRGYKQRYRLRFGDAGYRIIYEVFPRSTSVRVVAVGPRTSIYRGMRRPAK